MYTVIPRQELDDHHRSRSGEPPPEIIDHRKPEERKPYKWKNRVKSNSNENQEVTLQAELRYQHRIKELEKQSEELARTYDETAHENKVLKSIIEHGPHAAKVKKLQKVKKEQKELIDMLTEENEELRGKVQQIETGIDEPKDVVMESNWNAVATKVEKARGVNIPIQGPFAPAKITKRKSITINDERPDEQDSYDLAIDSVEKETQVLLNKLKQLKREKSQIDYSLVMGKGFVSRNATVANAMNEKLNRDLHKFATRLEKLQLKHRTLTTCQRDIHNNSISIQAENKLELTARSESGVVPRTCVHNKQTTDRPVAEKVTVARKGNAKDNENNMFYRHDAASCKPVVKDSAIWSKSTKHESRHALTAQPSEYKKPTVSDIKAKPFPWQNTERDKTTKVTHKSKTPNDSPHLEQKTLVTVAKKTNNEQNSSTKDKANSKLRKRKDVEEQQSTRSGKGSVLSTNKKKDTAVDDSMGRYAHGPEPTNPGVKSDTPGVPIDINNKTVSSDIPKLRFPFPTNRKGQKTERTKRETKEVSYDDVLDYLKRQSEEINDQVASSRSHGGKSDRKPAMSPVPINFKSDGRTFKSGELGPIMGNTGLRSNEHFYKYL